MTKFMPLLSVLLLITFTGNHKYFPNYNQIIDLSGTWKFQLDSTNEGIQGKWFNKALIDSVKLHGTTDENKKGIYLDEKAVDRLSRVWYWKSAAWYQKEVTIPENWTGKNVQITLERNRDTQPIILDETPSDYKSLVQKIDNFDRAHKLGMIVETKYDNGSVLIFVVTNSSGKVI